MRAALLALLAASPVAAEVVGMPVTATAETVGIDGDVDDPAIWVHPSDPARSLILGTDKTRGLHVFALDGSEVAFFEDGEVNNVDIRPVTRNGETRWLAAATERINEDVVFWWIDAAGAMTRAEPFAHAAAPADATLDDIYGFAMGRDPATGAIYALVNWKSGHVQQFEVSVADDWTLSLAEVRRFAVETQPEGIVMDDAAGHIYLGEEDVAIWRFPADPAAEAVATEIDRIGGDCLPVDDVEGLAIYDGPDGRWLVASAQGIHRYAFYPLDGAAAPPCARLLEIRAGEEIDGVTETDGLDVVSAPLGPDFPEGMLVVMDDQNAGFTTNFKMVSWADIRAALRL